MSNKRTADGQGDRDSGSQFESPEDTPKRASTTQMASRRILSAKSRRFGGSPSNSGSSLEALGNPFASVGADSSTTSGAPNTNNNMFGQQPNGFNFGSPQPVSNNTQPFGSQTSSFPPAQSNNGGVFGNSFSAPSGGFSFSAGGPSSNPFSQNKTPSFGFGQPNGVNAGPSQNGTLPQTNNGGDMQISPPVTPEKAGNNNTTSSLFGTMSGTAPSQSLFSFSQSQSQSQQSAPAQTTSQSTSNPFAFNQAPPAFGPFSSNKPPTFSFGQPAAPAPERQSSPPKQQENPFQSVAKPTQDTSTSTSLSQAQELPKAESVPSTVAETKSSGLFSTPSFSFGGMPQPSISQAPAAASASSTLFQPPTSNPLAGFGSAAPSTPSQSATSDLYPRLSKPVESIPSAQPFSSSNIFSRPSQPNDASSSAPAFNPFASIQKPQSSIQSSPQQQFPSTQDNAASSTGPFFVPPTSQSVVKKTSTPNSVGLSAMPANLTLAQNQAYQSQIELRSLNVAFRNAVAAANLNYDWTELVNAYLSQFSKIDSSKPATEMTEGSGPSTKRKADENLSVVSAKRSRAADPPANTSAASLQNVTGKSQTANLFQSILDKKDTAQPTTPTKQSNNLFTPSTTPAGPPPSTNIFGSLKPAQSATPASNLFSTKPITQAAPSENIFAPKPAAQATPSSNLFTTQPATSTSNMFSPKPALQAVPPSNFFAPQPAKQVSAQTAASQPKTSGTPAPNPFASMLKASTPAVSSTTGSSAGQTNLFSPKPSATSTTPVFNPFASKGAHEKVETGFVPQGPSFSAPSNNNFQAQFGSTAAKDAEKAAKDAKAKRKAEEFDSDEDDEAEWERKYDEEQQAKKLKTDQSAKPPTFQIPQFSVPSVDPSNFASQFGSSAAKDAEKEAAEAKAKRKAEEFDSDEDDEEEWERNYEEEQRQKRAKLLQTSSTENGPKFSTEIPIQPVASSAEPSTNTTKPSFGGNKATSIFSAGNSFTGKGPATNNIFGHLSDAGSKDPSDEEGEEDEEDGAGEEEEEEEEEEAGHEGTSASNSTGARSLLDRVTPAESSEGEQGKAANSPAADHTWKVNSPIKFNASAAPTFSFSAPTPTKPSTVNGTDTSTSSSRPFAGLFGATKPDTSTSLFGSSFNKFTTPSSKANDVGFTFGGPPSKPESPAPSFLSAAFGGPNGSALTSAATSRASSPGIPPSVAESTDGGATDADADDAEPPVAQSDFTGLSEEEKLHEDILFEVDKGRCSLFTKGAEQPWTAKGTGPVRVLRNKASGAVRILVRAAPSGKIVMNNRLNKGFTYTFAGKGTTRLMIVGAGGKPETWAVKMAKDEDAKEFARVCESNKSA